MSDTEGAPSSAAPATPPAPWSRTLAIGCVMVPLGFFSGGMIAVLVSKVVAFATHAKACEGVPSCNWLEFMLVGAAIGALSLPSLVVWALRSPKRQDS